MMRDFSADCNYSQRHMVTGWYDNDGRVIEVQAFYCQNGPTIDGQWNVREGGVVKPGPAQHYALYFIPDVGVSTSLQSLYANRRDAVKRARRRLEDERDRIDDLLAELI